MWFAVDAEGPGARAWPLDAGGDGGEPSAAASLPAGAEGLVIDGGAKAYDIALPVPLSGLVRSDTSTGPKTLQVARPAGLARLVGGQRLARNPAQDANPRPWHACLCRADGQTVWAYGAEGQLRRLSVQPVERVLRDLLRELAAADGDDDLGFERGLSLTEAERDPAADLAQVIDEARAGRLKGEAVGANLAGVLIGHDATNGIRLGRPGQPVAVIGAGLMAQRYAIALGRFGVAVRRIDPDRALVAGAAFFAQCE
ncbi:MAG: 2-dehydro-3-deoxygalactonokinase [Rhodospirillales bacterium]|nr:2-dehydro-3-deoxygalactonokinase [Rhodospirillales bacterium]